MMSRWTRATLFLALLLGVSACTSKPVATIESTAVPAAVRTEEAMQRAILTALQRRQWTVERAEPGQILALVQRRSHQARVSIPYTASGYSIRYRDSQNLDYRNGKIHRNYNNWIHNLDRSIQQELSSPSLYLPQ